MSSNYIIHKSAVSLLIVGVLTLSGCLDDFLPDNGQSDPWQASTDNVFFSADVMFPRTALSRSDSDIVPYEPLELISEEDSGYCVYLHTYSHPIGGDLTEKDEPESRGYQVKSKNDLARLHKSFGVRAVYDNGAEDVFFEMQEAVMLIQDSTLWTTGSPYRWPEEGKLRFSAVAPFSHVEKLTPVGDSEGSVSPVFSGNTVSFSYEAEKGEPGENQDAVAQKDLLLAAATVSRADTEDFNYRAPLRFHHALSAVKFAVRDVLNGEVESITVKGIKGSGDCVFTAGEYSKDEDGGMVNTGTFEWTPTGDNTSYTQLFNHRVEDKYSSDKEDFTDADDVVLNDAMPEKTFMLIPQALTDDATIEIILRRDPDSDGNTYKRIKVTGKILDNQVKEWEAGHEYVYTISTSKSNWTYIFEVTGSVQQENEADPKKGTFSNDEHKIEINATVTDGAYYNVASYRQRTNNPKIVEPVAWTAVSTNGENQDCGDSKIQGYIAQYKESWNLPMIIAPESWFPEIGVPAEGDKLCFDGEGNFSGDGSKESKMYKVKFKTQYVATDWDGDWEMRSKDEIGGADYPIDLSLNNSNSVRKNTANCYVVNRGGWYKFPLVYGNAIVEGEPNESAYTFDGVIKNNYPPLKKFTDYKDKGIEGPYIGGAKSTRLVWQDAYDIIDHIELVNNSTEVLFHVSRADLQQSNSVIGVCDDNGDIIWSWHIWVNEHMVDDQQHLVDGIECEVWSEEDADAGYGPFKLAVRNLGWCDPKHVAYLERTGTLTFRQAGGNTPEKTLNVKQRGKVIEFFIGNNTYYQWGRKDPMVGFRYSGGDKDLVKYNFGEIPYDFMDYTNAKISDGIKNPSKFLAGVNGNDQNDWLANDHYYNLWNNYYNEDYFQKTEDGSIVNEPGRQTPLPTTSYAYSGVKTIYDPSPAGFMVPPQKLFEIFTKGQNEHNHVEHLEVYGRETLAEVFNGTMEQVVSYYQYNAYTNRSGTGGPEILLTGTGQRWHRTGHSIYKLGGNMNPNHVYLWPNSISFYSDNGGLTFVVGNEGKYISTTRMLARRSIARPIRSVKEYQQKALQ